MCFLFGAKCNLRTICKYSDFSLNYRYFMPVASLTLPYSFWVRGTNAATQTLASKTLGHSILIVFHPAFRGIVAGSRIQKNCSSVYGSSLGGLFQVLWWYRYFPGSFHGLAVMFGDGTKLMHEQVGCVGDGVSMIEVAHVGINVSSFKIFSY